MSIDSGRPIVSVKMLLILGAGFLLAAFLICTVVLLRGWSDARAMVRSDPDSILEDAALRPYAMAEGRRVFDDHCVSCHGAAGRGDHSLGVPDLTDRDFLYGQGRVSEIEEIVRHGIRAGDRQGRNFAYMPAYASPKPYEAEPIPPLTPDGIADVVQFILKRGGRPADLAAASRGETIFQGVGGCYDCHGVDARGDPAIGTPNLIDDIWLYGDGSPAAITQSIERGRKGFCPSHSQTLSAAEMRAVAVFTASLSQTAFERNGMR